MCGVSLLHFCFFTRCSDLTLPGLTEIDFFWNLFNERSRWLTMNYRMRTCRPYIAGSIQYNCHDLNVTYQEILLMEVRRRFSFYPITIHFITENQKTNCKTTNSTQQFNQTGWCCNFIQQTNSTLSNQYQKQLSLPKKI